MYKKKWNWIDIVTLHYLFFHYKSNLKAHLQHTHKKKNFSGILFLEKQNIKSVAKITMRLV